MKESAIRYLKGPIQDGQGAKGVSAQDRVGSKPKEQKIRDLKRRVHDLYADYKEVYSKVS